MTHSLEHTKEVSKPDAVAHGAKDNLQLEVVRSRNAAAPTAQAEASAKQVDTASKFLPSVSLAGDNRAATDNPNPASKPQDKGASSESAVKTSSQNPAATSEKAPAGDSKTNSPAEKPVVQNPTDPREKVTPAKAPAVNSAADSALPPGRPATKDSPVSSEPTNTDAQNPSRQQSPSPNAADGNADKPVPKKPAPLPSEQPFTPTDPHSWDLTRPWTIPKLPS